MLKNKHKTAVIMEQKVRDNANVITSIQTQKYGIVVQGQKCLKKNTNANGHDEVGKKTIQG